MFWRNNLLTKVINHRNSVLFHNNLDKKTIQHANFSGCTNSIHNISTHIPSYKQTKLLRWTSYNISLGRDYSQNILDGVIGKLTESNNVQHDTELKKVTELFPHPRVTLKEYQEKVPQKVFDVQYKQNVSSPKGVRKNKKVVNDWTCSYVFVSPEKVKFESTALSKRLAAEKAAIHALHHLYTTKRIDANGNPVYNRDVVENLKRTVNQPITIEIGDKSVERIEKIWEDYESGIKNIYESTLKEAKKRLVKPSSVFVKDSTIDEEDDLQNDESLSKDDYGDQRVHIHPVYGKTIQPPTKSTLERRDRVLIRKFERYDEGLQPLPIDQYGNEIATTVSDNRVTIISGAAGCGKSTRVPAAILKYFGAQTAAIVTEPRRVAAIGLAERVANEMGEDVGDTIGYQVRLHAKPPRPQCGSILYCTSGVLLRRLQTNPGLEGCTHVFLDEAHERDVNTDLTLLLLKRALELNDGLKLIVMSATLDIGVFTRYFNRCPVIEVPGRTYPVKVTHLDEIQKKYKLSLSYTMRNCQKQDGRPMVNCQEVVEIIKAIDKHESEGAILVFLPGWNEIKQAKLLLDRYYGNDSMHLILPVHSRLSTADQSKMFNKALPGVRKIVLATNIAETSITIPDVVHVIDSGASKENRIKEGTGTASLETVWVSKAAARQRAGRAGRVQPGHCYRLYTSEREDEFIEHTTPEILRIPLETTVLDCKNYAPNESIKSFLSELPEPPSNEAIQFAVNDLIELGALTETEEITRLGTLLSRLTLHPRLGRGVLNAAIIGSVVSAANTVTHCSDNVELFTNASERRDEIREIKRKFHPTSDHVALHWIQEEFDETLHENRVGIDKWCDRYGLRRDRLNYVKSISNLHLEQLLSAGILEPTVDHTELNRFSDVDELTSAILLSGANRLMRSRKWVRTKGKLGTHVELVTSTGDRAHIGSESVNHNITKRSANTNVLLAYFGGHHSIERRALVVYKTSVVTPHTALIFCDTPLEMKSINTEVVLSLPKHKLEVIVPKSHADQILKAREMLWKTFQYYIERDLKTLDYDENTTVSRFKTRLVKAIGRLLIEADREYIQEKGRRENSAIGEE